MVRYKAVIAYDGTHYHGFQTQDNAHTVQAEIEKTLKKLNNQQPIPIHPSGRTDAGVHAQGQVIHFDYPQEREAEKFRHALDTQTPPDIAVLSLEQVADDFHARYHAVEKTYHYRVDIGKPRNPFKRFYTSYYPYPLDIEKMQRAARDLLGTHDFSSFCATGSAVEDKTRTIYEARIEHDEANQELLFVFRGNGFLYKMVRILVGTLLKIGNDRLPEENIRRALLTEDRSLTGPTAHPEGLYLMNVSYETKKDGKNDNKTLT